MAINAGENHIQGRSRSKAQLAAKRLGNAPASPESAPVYVGSPTVGHPDFNGLRVAVLKAPTPPQPPVA
jgi:hypothetical protein